MSLIKSYMSVLNESKEDLTKSSVVTKDIVGELDGAKDAKKFAKGTGPEEVEGLEKPVEGPHSKQEKDALPKSVGESKNPFDLLYNKIVAEEAFGEEEGEGTTLSFDGQVAPEEGSEEPSEEGDLFDEELPEDSEEEEEEETGLAAVIAHLKKAVEALEQVASAEQGEEEEDDLGEESPEEGEEESEESPLDEVDFEDGEEESPVSQESVEHGTDEKPKKFDKKSKLLGNKKQEVKGAVPVKKKKVVVPKGSKEQHGKPVPFKGNLSGLQGKNNKVGAIQAKKGVFEQ